MDKIEVIKNFSVPNSDDFLTAAVFTASMSKALVKLQIPCINCWPKIRKFDFTKDCMKTFETLITAPVLQLPDHSKDFISSLTVLIQLQATH